LTPRLGKASGNGEITVIGHGSLMEGTLAVEHPIHVEGTFRGQLKTPTSLVVGEAGELESDDLDVGEAVIHGKVTGRVKASGKVHLGATAILQGSVETLRLIVEEGAQLLQPSPP
jgi:cytoskeletal protein CcmA (bactofilin family)